MVASQRAWLFWGSGTDVRMGCISELGRLAWPLLAVAVMPSDQMFGLNREPQASCSAGRLGAAAPAPPALLPPAPAPRPSSP